MAWSKLVAVAAALAVLFVPPVVMADQPGCELTETGRSSTTVAPETGVTEVYLSLRCDRELADAMQYEISFRLLASPAYSAPEVSPSSLTVTGNPGQEFYAITTLAVTTGRYAPAYEVGEYDVFAQVKERSVSGQPVTATTKVRVANEYRAFLDVTAPDPSIDIRPGQSKSLEFNLINGANGQTRARLVPVLVNGSAVGPQLADGGIVEMDARLAPPVLGSHAAKLYLDVAIPADARAGQTYEIGVDVLGSYAGTPPSGAAPTQHRQTFVITVQVVASGPAPSMLTVGLVLVLVIVGGVYATRRSSRSRRQK